MTNMKNARNALCSFLAGAAMATAFCAPASAIPTQYDIAFSGGSPTPTGSFSYDPTVPTFADFTVMWNGLDFDLTGAANNPVFNAGTTLQLPLCGASAADAALTFGMSARPSSPLAP